MAKCWRWGVEPTMFFYMMAYMLTSVVEEDLIVYKSCIASHGYPREICVNISQPQYQEEKKIIQVTVSRFHMWENIASHAVPAILALFLGSWSDRVGRKIPLLMGLCGSLIYSLSILINSLNDSWRVEWILLSGALPCGFTGGHLAVFMAAFSYLADTTSTEDRTFRTTLLEVSYLITMPLGVALGSFLFNKVFYRSHAAMFALNCSCLVISIVYSWLALELKTSNRCNDNKQSPAISRINNKQESHDVESINFIDSSNSTNHPQDNIINKDTANDMNHISLDINERRSIRKFRALIFTVSKFIASHMTDSLRTLTKSRPENRRALLYLCLVALALYTFQREEKHSLYLYTQLVYYWDESVFSSFRTFQSFLYIIGLLIGVPLLNKVLSIRDTVIMMIGAMSHIAARITFSLADGKSLIYLGGSLGMLGPIVVPVIRSSVSKLVPSYERGKVFALLSVSDMAVPLISGALYSNVYSLSLAVFPQAVFILTITSQIIVFISAIWMETILKGKPISQCLEEKDNIFVQSKEKDEEKNNSISNSS